MRLPDLIAVRCLAGSEPFPAAWVVLTLEQSAPETDSAFSLAFGPAREDGRLLIQRVEVLNQARYFEQAIGLDYGRLEERWSGQGWLAVADAAELRHQFRLTFGSPPLRQASAVRVAAARALRFLSELEETPLEIEVESQLPAEIELASADPAPPEWLPEQLNQPVLDLLGSLARHDLTGLIESGILNPDSASRIQRQIIAHGATPVTPPDIALLLATATSHSAGSWTVVLPLWTREDGPSELDVTISARQSESGLSLELRDVAVN